MPLDMSPAYPAPAEEKIEAAIGDLAEILADLPNNARFANAKPDGPHRLVLAADLVETLAQKKAHTRAAAAHAVHRHLTDGQLVGEIAVRPQSSITAGGRSEDMEQVFAAIEGRPFDRRNTEPVTATFPARPLHTGEGPVPYDKLLVRSTDALWEANRRRAPGSGSVTRVPNRVVMLGLPSRRPSRPGGDSSPFCRLIGAIDALHALAMNSLALAAPHLPVPSVIGGPHGFDGPKCVPPQVVVSPALRAAVDKLVAEATGAIGAAYQAGQSRAIPFAALHKELGDCRAVVQTASALALDPVTAAGTMPLNRWAEVRGSLEGFDAAWVSTQCPEPAPAPVSAPPHSQGSPPLNRHLVFRTLKAKFDEASAHFPDFRIYPYFHYPEAHFLYPAFLRPPRRPSPRRERFAMGHGWSVHYAEGHESVYVTGPSEAMDLWDALSSQAGAALGEEMHRLRPVLPCGRPTISRADASGLWGNFVFNVLKDAGGLHLSIREHEDQSVYLRFEEETGAAAAARKDPPPTWFSTYATTATNIFAASSAAIDFAGLAESPPVSPPKTEGAATAAESDQSFQPSERQDAILAAMFELGATGWNRRHTRRAIASKVQRGLSATSIGADCATLRERGYVDSQEGSKGGCWLTGKGIDRAKQILAPPSERKS
jgi:hypothetical protein